MELTAPNLTSDRFCCPACRRRAPYLPNGLADYHLDGRGALCSGVFPSWVIARDPKGARRARRP